MKIAKATASTARVVFTVSAMSMIYKVGGRPTPVPRVFRDAAILQGAVRGYLAPHPPHFEYFGIPYARPPTRRDRFKAPKAPPEWDGIFEATHKIKCPQAIADGEENCLVLNVFVPEEAQSLPVLVFVHGGEFQNGWGAYHPPERLLRQNFVIVTFNYRLGALGFLSLGTSDAPGNAGLKDQIAALYWVHRNIAQFEGNPHDVTIYGTGSGAASVQLMLLSGLVKGFFHKVILESGSILSPASLTYDPLSIAYDGAASVGYEGANDPDELYDFYRHASVKDLTNIKELFLPNLGNELDYEYSLIDMDPVQALKKGNFYKVPMLITFTHIDRTDMIENAIENVVRPPDFGHMLPNNLEFSHNIVKYKVGRIVKEFYFNEDMAKDKMAQSYANYMYDIFTEYPMVKMAMLFAAKNTYSVYVMKFNLAAAKEGESEEAKNFNSILDYLYQEDVPSDDIILEKLMTLWRNFLKLSDPTPLITTLIPLVWQPLTCESEEQTIADMPMLLFDASVRMNNPLESQRLLFWDNIYNRFYKPHVVVTKNDSKDEVDDNNDDDNG